MTWTWTAASSILYWVLDLCEVIRIGQNYALDMYKIITSSLSLSKRGSVKKNIVEFYNSFNALWLGYTGLAHSIIPEYIKLLKDLMTEWRF